MKSVRVVNERTVNELLAGSGYPPEAGVNEYGDLVCPNCRANIITPYGYDVVPGIGRCSFCEREFTVTQEVADRANGRTHGSLN